MNSATANPALGQVAQSTRPWSQVISARLADYVQLAKLRIAVMSLLTVAVGYALGTTGEQPSGLLLHALLGIAGAAVSSSILNQVWEHRTDRRMVRTANRPIAAGRISVAEGLVLGIGSGVCGVAYLAWQVNTTTAVLAATTILLYVLVYTPLKQHSSLCTVVGALAGGLPPVLGWTAAGRELNAEAASLMGILFLWQFPHVIAIAWLYREQYHSAGHKMVPALRAKPLGWLAVSYAIVLLPFSVWPRQLGLAGDFYALTALVLGGAYLYSSLKFAQSATTTSARSLIGTSLLYLPMLLLALTFDHWRLLW